MLAGDVELNPGPVSSTNLNAYCLNIRSASVITATLNKPELIQQYILDEKIDALFLTETWFSPDTPIYLSPLAILFSIFLALLVVVGELLPFFVPNFLQLF